MDIAVAGREGGSTRPQLPPGPLRNLALWVVLPYVVFSVVWFVLGDRILERLTQDPRGVAFAEELQESIFVVVTAALLYVLISRALQAIERSTADLRENEARVQAILDNSPAAIWVKDLDGRYIIFNRGAEELMGLERAEVLGKTVEGIRAPDAVRSVQADDRRVIEQGAALEVEETFPRDGGPLTYLAVKFPLLDSAGRIYGISGIATDITERKRAQERLRESEERFRLLVDSVKEYAIVMLDEQGRVSSWNAGAERIKGYSAEEILGKHFSLFHEDRSSERGSAERALMIAKRDGEYRTEEWLVRKDGSRLRAEVAVTPLFDDRGGHCGYVEVCRDVTKEREADKAMEHTLSLLRSTLESTADGILVVDRDGKMVAYNQLFARLFEIPEDILASRDDERALEHAMNRLKEPHRFIDKVRELYASPDAESCDVVEFKDGRVIERYSTPQRIENEPVGRVWSFRDVTERRRAELELRHSVEMLKKIDTERRSVLAHLVNAQEQERKRIAEDVHDDSIQAMAAVAMRLDVLAGEIDPRHRKLLQSLLVTVHESIKRLRSLVFELRPEGLERHGIEVGLRSYLEQMSSQWGIDYKLEVELSDEPDPDLRVILYRMAQESLVNVQKHAAARSVRVSLKELGGGLILTIQDDGVGFDPAASRARAGHLGLVQLRERAEMAGGSCRVESKPGDGTTVRVWLPRDGEVGEYSVAQAR